MTASTWVFSAFYFGLKINTLYLNDRKAFDISLNINRSYYTTYFFKFLSFFVHIFFFLSLDAIYTVT